MSALRDSLPVRFPCRLRISLGGHRRPGAIIPTLLRALDLAREIVRDVFEASHCVSALFSAVREGSAPPYPYEADAYWASLGFNLPLGRPDRVSTEVDGVPGFEEFLYCVDLPTLLPYCDIVLWASLTAEIGFTSEEALYGARHGGEYYLVDFSRGLLMHVYDERGMNLFATTPAPLETYKVHVYDERGMN